MPAYLGQASIVLDQTGLTPGTAGRSRNDGVVGTIVNARNSDNTNILRWRWSLARPRASAATLSSTQGPTTTFTPDVDGTYALSLSVNEGKVVQQRQVLLFAVKNAAGKRYPAQGETIEANWTSVYTGQPNDTGWWEDLDEILRANQGVINGSIVTVVAEPTLANHRRLVAGPGLSFVDDLPSNTLTVDTAFTAGTELHADVVGQPENIVGTRTVDGPTHDVANYGQTNLGSEGLPGYGTSGNFATISGGYNNKATAQAATVGGGLLNVASAANAVVAGGTTNEATAAAAAVLGGSGNIASGTAAAVAGGTGNSAQDADAFVGGGATCLAVAPRSGVVAGLGNQATGDNSFVGAGVNNNPDGGSSAIVAGSGNEAQNTYSIVGAGQDNTAAGSHSGVLAGTSNLAIGDYSTVTGGNGNSTGSTSAHVGGGLSNTASGTQSFVGAGNSNAAVGTNSVVVGGDTNTAQGTASAVLGGRGNTASGDDTFCMGRGGFASHNGSAIIKDGQNISVSSGANNELTVRFDGGIKFITTGAKLRHQLGSSTNNYSERVMGSASTTDAVLQSQTIATIPNGANVTIIVRKFDGKQTSSNNCKSLDFKATYTNNGGVVALVNGTSHVNNTVNTAGAAAWNAAIAISGTNININYTGAAATTIRWSWDIDVCYGGQT